MAQWRSNIFSALILLLGGSVFVGGDLLASAPARAEADSAITSMIFMATGTMSIRAPGAHPAHRVTPGGSGVKGACLGRL